MNIIETSAPIKIEDLKKYFVDKETFYLIDYESSELKGAKLLTYLSNLDIPCDLKIDLHSESVDSLLVDYLNSPFLVNIPSIEKEMTKILLQYKRIADYGYASFIEKNKETLDDWTKILDSLLYYNTYTINDEDYKEQIKNSSSFDKNFTIGVNFVSLLKHDIFFDFYITANPDNFKYHEVYFNDYIFKGKNLYYYWANTNNPIFIITWAIESGEFNPEEFALAMKKDIEEIQSVSFV